MARRDTSEGFILGRLSFDELVEVRTWFSAWLEAHADDEEVPDACFKLIDRLDRNAEAYWGFTWSSRWR